MEDNGTKGTEKATADRKGFAKRVAFFLGMTGTAAIGGFGMMLARSGRQRNPDLSQDALALESGAGLARKALGRATVYAVGGFSIFCFIAWKLIGAKDLNEFSEILGRTFPKINRPREPEVVDWGEILYGTEKKENS